MIVDLQRRCVRGRVRMSKLVNAAGFAWLLVIAAGLCDRALADKWIDTKTGESVTDFPYIEGAGENYNVVGPGGGTIGHVVLPSAGDRNKAFDPATGRNFARDKDGYWIDVKTGKRVGSFPYIEGAGENYNVVGPGGGKIGHVVLPNAGDPKHAFDPATGRNFVRVDPKDTKKARTKKPRRTTTAARTDVGHAPPWALSDPLTIPVRVFTAITPVVRGGEIRDLIDIDSLFPSTHRRSVKGRRYYGIVFRNIDGTAVADPDPFIRMQLFRQGDSIKNGAGGGGDAD
jgi:hypothetical protein